MDTMTEDIMAGKPVGFIDTTVPPADAADNPAEAPAPSIAPSSEQDSNGDLPEYARNDPRIAEQVRAASMAMEALKAAREKMSEEDAEDEEAEQYSVDVETGVGDDRQLSASKESVDAVGARTDMIVPDDKKDDLSSVEITDDEKQAFIDAVVSGGRYRNTVTIFGGRVVLGLRARTVGESEAIDSYIRRRVSDGTIKVGVEYSDNMRLCLLVSDVERLGDEVFPEMSKPLMAVSTPDGVVEPEWTKMLDVWRSKPEGLVNAILPEIFKFEVKYGEMVKHGSDENFWPTGESTGE